MLLGLALGLVLLDTVLIHRETIHLPRYGDEGHHLRQILLFCHGEWRSDPKQATIPGFHLATALIARAVGADCTMETARTINTGFGLLSVLVFLLAVRRLGSTQPGARTLQYHLLPILLPYQFLVYTDTLSLLLVLASLVLLLRGSWTGAGLVGSVSILVRQSNVAWLGFILLYAVLEPDPWRWPGARRLLGRVWASLLGIAGFFVFVALNGAVALHEKGSHRMGLYFGNLFFALFVYGILFLPSVAARLWAERRRLTEPWLLALLLGAWLLFLWGFKVDHPYNHFAGFLRNDLLMAVDREPFLKPLFFLPVALGLAALCLTRLRRGSLYAVYPYALAMLLPAWVIEMRYAFIPLVLLLLFRREDEPWIEGASVVYSGVVATLLLYGITGQRFAL